MIAATSLVVACVHQVPVKDDLASRPYEAIELVESPFFPQDKYQCGPAALATVLNHAGIPVTPEELVPGVYLPERRGSLQPELVATARHYDRLPYIIDPSVSAIIEELNTGHPVLVLQNLGWEHYPVWHYAVVIGYEPKSGDFILRSGKTKRLTLDADRFAGTWASSNNWGVVILRPGELPTNPDATRYLASVAAMEEVGRFESAGQAYAAAVERWPDNTIAWLGLGNTRYHTGAFVGAESAYRRALALDEANPFAQNNLALALAQRGCYLQAKSVIDKAIRSVSDPATLEMLKDTKRGMTDYPGVDEGRCYQPSRR